MEGSRMIQEFFRSKIGGLDRLDIDEEKGRMKVAGFLVCWGKGAKQGESKLWRRTRIAVEDHELSLCRVSLRGSPVLLRDVK